MKQLFISIVVTIWTLTSFAQATADNFKTAYYQRVVQGLGEESMAPQISSVAVKTLEIEPGKVLEYAEQGDPQGMPVILLHGIADSWHSFDQLLPLLPYNYHVFALSQRGHGNSDKTFGRYTPKDFAKDVAAFISRLQTGPAVIAGHSMGGVVAQCFAIDYPQLTKGLVIVSADAAFNTNPDLANFMAAIDGLKDPLDSAFMYAFQKSTFIKPVSDAMLGRIVAESLKVPAAVFQAAFKGILKMEILSSLHAIKAPSLIAWGNKDSFCSLAGQMKMRRKIKASRLLIYSGTGHALHWEEPERFAKDLRYFLKTMH